MQINQVNHDLAESEPLNYTLQYNDNKLVSFVFIKPLPLKPDEDQLSDF